MNIFKFHLWIEAKSSVNSISQEIINTYMSKSKELTDYKEHVVQTWNGLGKERVIALYPISALLVCGNIARSSYFLVDLNKSHDIDQMTIEVFVESELEDISTAYNLVYQDIKKKLSGKFKISLTENQVLLYVFDGNDIISPNVVVKANIISFTGFRKIEIIRGCILGGLAIIFVIIAGVNPNATTVCNIMYSLAASSIFFIVTEFLIKISVTQQIEIKDLTNWIKTEDIILKIDDQNIELSNPSFEEE